jgi:hypothetical protein
VTKSLSRTALPFSILSGSTQKVYRLVLMHFSDSYSSHHQQGSVVMSVIKIGYIGREDVSQIQTETEEPDTEFSSIFHLKFPPFSILNFLHFPFEIFLHCLNVVID